MKSSQTLIDSLTSHIALYSSSSSSSNLNTSLRSSILRHLSSLPAPSLQSILTFTDPKFTKILLQMHRHITAHGPSLFFLLPDIPSDDNQIPSLCTRRSTGLLSRKAEKTGTVLSNLLLFGAKDENEIDSVTLDVKNVKDFAASMDEVTGGRFLRGEEKGLGEEWKEMGWLKERGYFSMEEFAANRIEVVLRRGWSKGKWKGGESAFWRKKGCVDWWVGLEEKVRRDFCQEYFGKAAKLLVNEIVERKDLILNNKFDFFNLEAELPKDFGQKSKKPVGRSFSVGMPRHLVKLMNKLVVIQEIYSIVLACQLNKVEIETLFFSKVQSVLTVSDCILRKFRGLIMVVSIDHISRELLGEERVINLPKKNEEKKANKKCRKGKKNKYNSKHISSLPNSSISKPAATETIMTDECMPECITDRSYKLNDQDGDISVASKAKDPGKENVNVIADKKNPADRKRRKGMTSKHKNSKKMVEHETENIQNLLPVVLTEDKVEEVTFPIMSDSVANKDNCVAQPLSNEKHKQALTSSLSDTGSVMKSFVTVDKHMNPNASFTVGNCVNSIHTQHINTSMNEQCAALHNNVHVNYVGGTSHEWPRTTPHHLSSSNSNHLPPATDRLHLDVGHKLPNRFNQPFIPLRCSARNSPSLKLPVNYDWPQVVNNFDIYDLKTKSEFPDDAEYWLSEEEIDLHAISGRDFNQYFGGGVMYWNTAEHAGPSFSRPPSHSSEDSSWAWYEADMNRAIDDMIGMPGLSFDHNGDILEDGASVSLNNSASCGEGIKIDTLPYTMLRPIIVPRISRERSQSEFNSHDLNSPCMPSTSRSDHPRTKRPPSPVVLCVPRVPHPPPPSPVGESRRRGFPIVRSGSSSPRHWGMRGCYYEDGIISDDPRLCLDGAEVVRPSWVTKGQSFKGPILQNHLLKEHPDAALPLQPPDSLSCPHKASLPMLHNVLHEEIDFFCKQVAAENLIKRPYVNWAVKTATRALQDVWPRSRANIFGSNATGLALPSSDVDLVVSLPPVRNLEPIKEAGILEGRNGIKETCLQHAARYLANQEWVRNDSLKTIENTAIPIIMLVAEVPQDINYCDEQSSLEAQNPHRNQSNQDEKPLSKSSKRRNNDGIVNSVRLDISFKTPSHTGIQTSKLVKELTQQFPASVPLALVLKKFLADRNLDHSYSGGLSSYCLVLLITRFLQHEHHIGRPVSQNLGSLLMDFLYFFGNVFDPRQMRISIQGSGVYMKRERGLSIDPIHIDDPLFPSNNVGRNCFRIHQCIKAFADAYTLLESELSHFLDETGPCSTEPFELLRKIIPSIDRE